MCFYNNGHDDNTNDDAHFYVSFIERSKKYDMLVPNYQYILNGCLSDIDRCLKSRLIFMIGLEIVIHNNRLLVDAKRIKSLHHEQ